MKKMKMTPEQKAFYEYGGAWELVVLTHMGIRATVKALPGKTRQKLLKQTRNETHQHELLLNAWQKRAACRAWVPMEDRYCNNCLHFKLPASNSPCAKCSQWADPVNWEPRKEEQDND